MRCDFQEGSEVKDRHFCSLFYCLILYIYVYFFTLSFMLNAICQLSFQQGFVCRFTGSGKIKYVF